MVADSDGSPTEIWLPITSIFVAFSSSNIVDNNMAGSGCLCSPIDNRRVVIFLGKCLLLGSERANSLRYWQFLIGGDDMHANP